MMTFEEIPEKLDEVLKLNGILENIKVQAFICLLYTSPSPRD